MNEDDKVAKAAEDSLNRDWEKHHAPDDTPPAWEPPKDDAMELADELSQSAKLRPAAPWLVGIGNGHDTEGAYFCMHVTWSYFEEYFLGCPDRTERDVPHIKCVRHSVMVDRCEVFALESVEFKMVRA